MTQSDARNAVIAGFLGWTLDAFDFFILTFLFVPIAKDFGTDIPHITFALSASLFTRPIGAIVFGLLADRFGRRVPLVVNILYYSLIEVLSGLAPNYHVFLALRLLYGIGMGGEWGIGASLTMESVAPRWRGLLSGLLQEGYALGFLLAAGANSFVAPHFGWRAMFFVGGIPALLTLFVRARVKEPEAWHRSRTDWATYKRVALANWRRFGYLIVLMAAMSMISHGSQDNYPQYLKAHGFSNGATSSIVALSMVGALIGGLTFGSLSDRIGRRRAMMAAAGFAILLIPLWLFAPSTPLLVLGGFTMQFMVQGAWGVVPVHINELSPDQLRGFFPGLGYQIGALIAGASPSIEAVAAKRFGYGSAMGWFAATVLVLGIIALAFGPEERGIVFGRSRA